MIPKSYEMVKPILKFLSDGKEHKLSEIYEFIANDLSNEEKNETLSSGDLKYKNRVRFALNFELFKKSLVERPDTGIYKITQDGLEILKNDQNYNNKDNCNNKGLSIEEQLIEINTLLIDDLKKYLLNKILNNKSRFFENLILELFKKMGYAYENRAELTNKGADGGIDGIIYEDELGLSKIYTQAKRYQEGSNIGSKEIDSFAGALLRNKVDKGIFVTTSDFTHSAIEFAKEHKKIILVNGDKLLSLMIKFKIGVSVKETYEILEIDQNFFDDEDY